MSDELDQLVIARILTEVAADQFHDGLVTVDNDGKTVLSKLPYTVYMSSLGLPGNPRLSGSHGRTSMFVTLKHVGLTRKQVKAQAARVRRLLKGHRFQLAGQKHGWKMKVDSSSRVFKDDDAISPDGAPLFYCTEDMTVSVTEKEHN